MIRFAPFFALVLCLAPAARAGEIVFEEGIEYANPDDQHLKFNLARPKDAKEGDRLATVVCIHGGGFRGGDRKGWDAFCKKLAERGYVAVTVTYRLAPKFQYPAAIHDVKAAVQFLRANADKYHVDPDRIGAVGDSAGGHLALFLGVTADVPQFQPSADQSSFPRGTGLTPVGSKPQPRPLWSFPTNVQAVVSFYGPSDFTRSYGKSVDAAEVLPLWLGGNVEKERRKHILASPLYWITPAAPPTLLLHGTTDKYVAHEQAVWMHDRLKAAEVDSTLITFEGAGHGFKGPDQSKAESATFDFFDKHLKKARRSGR
jgi:acetyl esterase/lipase